MGLGVLAFGDSITHGGGELQWGVALQSWALWTARGLGLPYMSYAFDGARAVDVVKWQIPAFERTNAQPDGPYDLACLYIGVNDVRAVDWDAEDYERDLRAALSFMARRAEGLLTLTIPLGLGLPPAGAKVVAANRIIEEVGRESGALIADLRMFRGRRILMADQVHPTAFGQIAIACKALETLAAHGLPARADPWAMVAWDETRLGRLRGDATYAYRRAKEALKAAAKS